MRGVHFYENKCKINKAKIIQFLKSVAHNQVDFSFKVVQIFVTFKNVTHLCAFCLWTCWQKCTRWRSRELVELDIV